MEPQAQRETRRGGSFFSPRVDPVRAARTAGGPTIVKPLGERVCVAAGGGGRDEGGQTRRGAHGEPLAERQVCKRMANDKATCFPNSAHNPEIPAAPFSFVVTNGFD